MTADRWWVRVSARWLARVDGVSGQLRLAMLGLTGISTMTVALQDAGRGGLAPFLITLLVASAAAFAYLYSEGGVWNQVARDRQDMSNNYAGPNGRIQAEMLARGLEAARNGEPLSDAERDAISDELDETFDSLRDGVEIAD